MSEKKILTTTEVAQELGICLSTFKYWVRFRWINPFRILPDGTAIFTEKEIAEAQSFAQERRRKVAA